MTTGIKINQTVKQKMLPKTIQSLQLLALPVMCLNEYLAGIVTANPLLEMDYPAEEQRGLGEFSNTMDDDPAVHYFDYSFSSSKKMNQDRQIELTDCWGKVDPEIDTLEGFLFLQLTLCNFSSIEQEIGEEIIGNIDPNGYFVGDLAVIACYYGQSLATVEKILKKIQSFYPPGIGARNLAECLLLQVDTTLDHADLVLRILKEDLEDLAYRYFVKVAQKYKTSKEKIQKVFDYISTLNPRPGNIFKQDNSFAYVVPDILIEKNGEGFSVSITGKNDRLLHINRNYLSCPELLDSNSKAYLRQKYSEAKNLLECLEMRSNMLQEFSLFLIKEQQAFFREGKKALAPLTMQQAAEKIGVNVSTISRTVQGKYAQTPWGIFPLKYFFSGAITSAKEPCISSRVIKERIKRIIAAENPHTPLTDADIAQILQDQGFAISRRTVAKYRQSLGLEGQRGRQRFG